VIERDVDWQQVASEPISEDAASMIESFYVVESYLPDFAAKGLTYSRRLVGVSNAHINWSYEELKHGRTLQLVLERSGARTAEQTRSQRLDLARNEWTPPYLMPRQMLIYGAFQEKETGRNYGQLRDVLTSQGGIGAAHALRIIARDEAFHHAFYRDLVRMMLEYDEKGTARDIEDVLRSFRMPAQHLMPDAGERLRVMVRNTIVGKNRVWDETLLPTIKAFGFRDADELHSVASAAPESPAAERAAAEEEQSAPQA
jgi:acyl-[acyl-carrier-protein] desaturase